jgi:hypothetical protein
LYKDDKNVTWQEPGRRGKGAGIRTEHYNLAYHTPGHVLHNPEAGLAGHETTTKSTHVLPESELYYHNDPRIPASRLGEEVFGYKELDKKTAKKELLPADKPWINYVDPAKPGTEEQQMLSDHRKIKEQQASLQFMPHEPKPIIPRDLKVESNASWTDVNKNEKRSNFDQEINTFDRKVQELSSKNNPLSTCTYEQYVPATKKVPVYENIDDRVKNSNYSDLFNQTGHMGPKPKVEKHSEISSQTAWFSKEGQDKGFRWGEDVSAAERRQEFMRTTGFPTVAADSPSKPKVPKVSEINKARHQLRMPKVIKACEMDSTPLHDDTFYQKYNVVKDHQEINVLTLSFNSLPPEMDTDSLRAISMAKHVVRTGIKTDNIKNL